MAAPIQYLYAFDEDNNLIFIGDVVKERRYKKGKFKQRCINGEKRLYLYESHIILSN